MPKTSPAVLAALQVAHDANATLSEKWHKQEHEFKVGLKKYPKLGKWFDRRHKEANDRQHELRRHIQRNGGKVGTALGDTSYYTARDLKSPEDMKSLFTDTAASLEGLHDRHAAVYEAAEKAGDRETCERFYGVHKELAGQARKARRKAQMVDDLGLPEFLAKHS
jgi:hypothetical protein